MVQSLSPGSLYIVIGIIAVTHFCLGVLFWWFRGKFYASFDKRNVENAARATHNKEVDNRIAARQKIIGIGASPGDLIAINGVLLVVQCWEFRVSDGIETVTFNPEWLEMWGKYYVIHPQDAGYAQARDKFMRQAAATDIDPKCKTVRRSLSDWPRYQGFPNSMMQS